MQDLTHVRFHGAPPTRTKQALPRLATSSQSAIGPLAAFILTRAGLDPAVYRHAPLERRVPACLRALGVTSELAGTSRLEARPALLPMALDTLLIGVSEFFRDEAVFESLKSRVMPALEGCNQPLRVWSVGCSSGEELYSTAILLAEAGVIERAALLGTDCREQAIDAAREGQFTADALARVPPALASRYFRAARQGGQVVDALRARVTWAVADATGALPDGPFDLVLCRNLVIYLQPHAVDRLFRALAGRLAPGGFLVVGQAERVPPGLGLVQDSRGIYRRGHA